MAFAQRCDEDSGATAELGGAKRPQLEAWKIKNYIDRVNPCSFSLKPEEIKLDHVRSDASEVDQGKCFLSLLSAFNPKLAWCPDSGFGTKEEGVDATQKTNTFAVQDTEDIPLARADKLNLSKVTYCGDDAKRMYFPELVHISRENGMDTPDTTWSDLSGSASLAPSIHASLENISVNNEGVKALSSLPSASEKLDLALNPIGSDCDTSNEVMVQMQEGIEVPKLDKPWPKKFGTTKRLESQLQEPRNDLDSIMNSISELMQADKNRKKNVDGFDRYIKENIEHSRKACYLSNFPEASEVTASLETVPGSEDTRADADYEKETDINVLSINALDKRCPLGKSRSASTLHSSTHKETNDDLMTYEKNNDVLSAGRKGPLKRRVSKSLPQPSNKLDAVSNDTLEANPMGGLHSNGDILSENSINKNLNKKRTPEVLDGSSLIDKEVPALDGIRKSKRPKSSKESKTPILTFAGHEGISDTQCDEEERRLLINLENLRAKMGDQNDLTAYKRERARVAEIFVEKAKLYPPVSGVYFDKYQQRWSVNWNESGRRIARYFPVRLYGFQAARNFAIECRGKQNSTKHIGSPSEQENPNIEIVEGSQKEMSIRGKKMNGKPRKTKEKIVIADQAKRNNADYNKSNISADKQDINIIGTLIDPTSSANKIEVLGLEVPSKKITEDAAAASSKFPVKKVAFGSVNLLESISNEKANLLSKKHVPTSKKNDSAENVSKLSRADFKNDLKTGANQKQQMLTKSNSKETVRPERKATRNQFKHNLRSFKDSKMLISKSESRQYLQQLKNMPHIPGVWFDKVQYRWACNYIDKNRRRAKYFPVKDYGFSKGRKLAISTRNNFLSKRKNAPADNLKSFPEETLLPSMNISPPSIPEADYKGKKGCKGDYLDRYFSISDSPVASLGIGTLSTTACHQLLLVQKEATLCLLRDIRNTCLLNLQSILGSNFSKNYISIRNQLKKVEKTLHFHEIFPYLRIFGECIEERKMPSDMPIEQQRKLVNNIAEFEEAATLFSK